MHFGDFVYRHPLTRIASFLVFHGGSGSTKEEIKTAVHNGVVKMNVDTDTQFAYLAGIRVCFYFGSCRQHFPKYYFYRTLCRASLVTFRLKSAIPRVLTSPTRRLSRHAIVFYECVLTYHAQYYDPRVWVREGEKTLTIRVKEACTDLGNVGMCPVPLVLQCSS